MLGLVARRDQGRFDLPALRERLSRLARPARSAALGLEPCCAISPDFRPAYDPLLSMAMALARSDVAGATTLLAELERVQPARPEALRLLERLRASAHTVEPATR
ncbi:MAG TPA: hypothetical protein VGD80_12735 [Kofleriaceae bacterium]